MSIVVYKEGMMAGDSVAMMGATQFRAPKVFPYRDAEGNTGVFGYVGTASVAHQLMKAWLSKKEGAYDQTLQRLKEIDGQQFACILVAPGHGKYLLLAGAYESFQRVPLQDMAIGFDEGVSLAQLMFEDPGCDWEADQIVARVIAMQNRSNECYVREPVIRWTCEITQSWDGVLEHPINGQFIYPETN